MLCMARPNRYQIMDLYKQDIVSALKQQNKKVLSNTDISSTLLLYEDTWKLPKSTKTEELLEFLVNRKKVMREVEVTVSGRDLIRYVFTDTKVTPIEFALSLYQNVYLSHYSAVSFHDLTNEIVKSVYVNKEQSEKSSYPTKELLQQNIDEAFSKPMRQTNSFFDFDGHRVYVLNGRFTDQLGVEVTSGNRVTNLERTLIDITVRPEYSGGVYEVLSVYERAKGQVSANKMRMYLQKLKYIYPYHQAVGFYLERAGYNETALKIMESIPIKHDFYLTYSIPEKAYSKRWRVYYPKFL